jgi:hypothetical protein
VRNPWTVWVRRWYLGGDPAPSTPTWKVFASLVPLYRSLTSMRVGNGERTSIWHDNWTSLGHLAAALPAAYSHCLQPDSTLGDFNLLGAGAIPVHDRLSRTADLELCLLRSALDRVQFSEVNDERVLAWGECLQFKTRAVYRMIKLSGRGLPLHGLNWDGFMPVKVKVFTWILRHGNTRTREFLHRIGFLEHDDCPFCPGRSETIVHLFLECPRLRPLWARVLGRPSVLMDSSIESVWRVFSTCHASLSPPLLSTAMCCVLWVIWKTRNRMVFDNIHTSDLDLRRLIQEHLMLWVVRAPSRVDCNPLLRWCVAVCS